MPGQLPRGTTGMSDSQVLAVMTTIIGWVVQEADNSWQLAGGGWLLGSLMSADARQLCGFSMCC